MMNGSLAVSHIVLIDDSPSDVYLMKLALKESGLQFEMTNFQSGAEALLALCPAAGAANDPLIPDLILLDLNTPGSDGFEVLDRIRGNPGLSHVPVAIITSSASPADKHRAALAGATTYIRKPTHLRAFMDSVGDAVKQLLGASAPKSS
jgi:CheY-like chemotaxis protein